MVKKLFKYEMLYYIKRLFIFEIILMSIALFTRFIYLFPSNASMYLILSGSVTFVFFVVNLLFFIMTVIAIITRFYQNLYSTQGYFTFTLPVTETQHLFVKLATAVLFVYVSLLSSVLSVAVATAGELGVEIVKAIWYTLGVVFDELKANLIFYILEFTIYMFASTIFGILIFYSCISLGQLAKKAKIFVAFGIYMIYCAVLEAVGTIFFMVCVFLPMDDIIYFITENIKPLLHIYLVAATIISAAMSIGLFFLNRRIMHKKLNLE